MVERRNNGGIHMNKNFNLNTSLFADVQVMITKTEDELQCTVNN
jgi:hypothetical protein